MMLFLQHPNSLILYLSHIMELLVVTFTRGTNITISQILCNENRDKFFF